MNGRVYDPTIGRFVSADPTLQFPLVGQSYDRYSYVGNNPLNFTDPSGYFSLGKALKKLGRAIAKPFEKAGRWLNKNWKTVAVVVVAVVITVASAGTLGPVAAGMLAGAASGALGAWLYGGDILEGAVVGAVFGALTAGFGEGLQGAVGAQFGSAAGTAAGIAGRGVVSGAQTEYYGGSFWSGFASGAVSQALSGPANRLDAGLLRTAGNFVVGGTASVVGGGKFENAAITAAYSSLLAGTLIAGQQQGKSIWESLGDFGKSVLNIATKIINIPNTVVGLAWGTAGWIAGGDAPIFANNAVVFRNSPLMGSDAAMTLGNTIIVGDIVTMSPTDVVKMMAHEQIHTYQGQVLGWGYLPANLVGGALSTATFGADRNDFWHGRANFMEGNPLNKNLYGY